MRSNLGKEPSYDDFEEGVDKGFKYGQLFMTGLASFLVTVIVYAGILYYVISVLNNSEIINGRIAWTELCLSVTAINLLRIWDRAFFKKR